MVTEKNRLRTYYSLVWPGLFPCKVFRAWPILSLLSFRHGPARPVGRISTGWMLPAKIYSTHDLHTTTGSKWNWTWSII